MGSRLEQNSNAVRKRIEKHTFADEDGEEYTGSKFGGFTDYFRRKKIKLQNLDAEVRAQSSEVLNIFRGVVCHVNGYTQPSLNDLHKLVVTHGGGFMQYLDGKTTVTHIIASNLTPKKAIEFRKYRIVKPAWIVDSIAHGKLLPWHAYRVLDEGVGQKVLGFEDGTMASQVNTKQRGYRDQTDTSWYTNQLSTQLQAPLVSSSFEDEITPDGLVDGQATDQPDTLGPDQAFKPDMIISPSQQEELARSFRDGDDDEEGGVGLPLASDAHSKVDTPGKLPSKHDETIQLETASDDTTEHMTSSQKRRHELGYPNEMSPSKKSKLTAEEHNSILLSDPRIRQSSVLNPEFLEQYYRESRLHHLSTWKADLKAQLQALTAEQTASQKSKQKRPPGARRYILHVDFDSFFVAVSLKKQPELTDKPACVAHGPGPQSEIASCNYPARAFGVKNGMWMKRAHELCSDLKVLPYDFPAYEEASRLFYDAIMDTGGIVQSVSVDEALVDVSNICLEAGGSSFINDERDNTALEQEKADEIAQQLRDRIKEQTGCAVSVGIGGNILLAKVSLRKAKPAGQYQMKPEEVMDFIGTLDVQSLPGVAWSIGGKLEEAGIKTVKDIRDTSKEKLVNLLGPKTGDKLWSYARGIDKTEVGEQVIRKSVSAEVNWGVRFETQDQAEEFVASLCEELNRRLVKERVKGKQFTMKIMRKAADAPLDPPKHLGHGKCDSFSKSVVLGVATDSKEQLKKEAISILRAYGFSPGELRGLGVQMTKLEPNKFMSRPDIASSQKRLDFAAGQKRVPNAHRTDAEMMPPPKRADRVPASSQRHLAFKQPQKPVLQIDGADDPIFDGPETPKKVTRYTAQKPATIASFVNSPGRRPLNTMGTQFIMPTQVDQEVLAELPPDIRSKLTRQSRVATKTVLRTPDPAPVTKPSFPATILPNESQLDLDMLDALPEDVRAEILNHYSTSPSRAKGQTLLPQSPRKNRIAPARTTAPTRGRARGGGLMARFKRIQENGGMTLTQSNFTTDKRAGSHEPVEVDGEISADFLEALPEEIRKEVLAQHRAEQLRRNGGLELARRRRAGPSSRARIGESSIGKVVVGVNGPRERVLELPARPRRPTFSSKKLEKLEDLRAAVGRWYEEFREEGPYEEDVEALGRYLRAVVVEESDMEKAVALVRWMGWMLFQGEENGGKWRAAIGRVEEVVREAVRSRGLGRVDF